MRSRAGARLGPRALWHHQGVRRRLHAAVRADGPRRLRPLDHRQRLEQPVDAPAEPRARRSSSSTTRTARALSVRRRDVDAPLDTWQTRHVSRTGAARRVGARVHVSPRPPRRHRNTDASRRVTSTPPSTVRPPTPLITDVRTSGHVDYDSPRGRLRGRPLLPRRYIPVRPALFARRHSPQRHDLPPRRSHVTACTLTHASCPGQVAAVPRSMPLSHAARPAPSCSPRQRLDVTIVAPVGGDGYSRAGAEFDARQHY